MGLFTRYVGRKNINLFPVVKQLDSKIYCEPFSGSFQAGFNLIRVSDNKDIKYIYNDIDSDLVLFWKCLIEDVDRLYNEYLDLRQKILSNHERDDKYYLVDIYLHSTDSFQKAAGKYICLTNRNLKENFTFSNLYHIIPKDIFLESLLDCLYLVIENLNYDKIFEKYDSEETFFFIDPPYYMSNINNFYCMGDRYFYHKALFENIKGLKGKWLLTYNNDPYILSLYKDYNIEKFCRKVYGVEYTELYISNFDAFDRCSEIMCKDFLDSNLYIDFESQKKEIDIESENSLLFEEVLNNEY